MNFHMMRSLGAALSAVILILVCSPVAARSGGPRDASFDGVSFRYDASLADGIEPKLVPEMVVTGTSGTWTARPGHIEFGFTDFHGASTQSMAPVIYIFPVRSDYTSLTPDESHDFWLQTIQQLQQLLSRQPDPRSIGDQPSRPPGAVPEIALLPPINAATILVGKPAYLGFQNGKGVRYLVQTTQDGSPPDRDNTSYTFQGLTSDGKYYIAAFFPAFPTTMQPIELFQGNDSRAYYQNARDRFNSISDNAYTPNLDLLDKMIGSLSVYPTSISEVPGIPSTGVDTEGSATIGVAVLACLILCAGGLVRLRGSGQDS